MIIYSITNKVNGKKYIGQTIKTLEQRIYGHLKCAKCGYDRKLYNAINKYGWENFEVKVECICNSVEELNKKETEYITRYNTVRQGYNMGYGGDNNVMFCKETRDKHDNSMKSLDVRNKISQSMKKLRAEKGFSQETRNKISSKLKGNQHGKGKIRPLSAILAAAKKNNKKVYCLDCKGNFIKQFHSVKEASIWWFSIDEPKLACAKMYCDVIKSSSVRNKPLRNLQWFYGELCVETIETINKGVE